MFHIELSPETLRYHEPSQFTAGDSGDIALNDGGDEISADKEHAARLAAIEAGRILQELYKRAFPTSYGFVPYPVNSDGASSESDSTANEIRQEEVRDEEATGVTQVAAARL